MTSACERGAPRPGLLGVPRHTSVAIACAALHSALNSCGSSSRSCACEAVVARAESPHALSALRSSFFCSVPAPAPCCFAGGVAAGVGRAPPASAGGGGREAGWGGLAGGLGLGLGSGLDAAGAASSSSSSSSPPSSPSSLAAGTCWCPARLKMMWVHRRAAAAAAASRPSASPALCNDEARPAPGPARLPAQLPHVRLYSLCAGFCGKQNTRAPYASTHRAAGGQLDGRVAARGGLSVLNGERQAAAPWHGAGQLLLLGLPLLQSLAARVSLLLGHPGRVGD
eukprot:scaffold15115_cov29-Phaeocystis_antarctica.AAC.1